VTDIQQQAVRKAVALLAAAGAEYAVMAAGKTYNSGNIEVHKRVKRSPKFDHVSKYNYIERIDAAGDGGVVKCVVKDLEEARSLQGALNAYVLRKHGHGKCITSLDRKSDGFHVSVMLVLNEPVAA
jgi:hypothetical protein